RAENLVEEVHAAHADRAQRIAVIALGERDELALLGLSPLLPMLEGHLQRDFHRRAAAVRVEDLGEAVLAGSEARLRRARDQLGGKLDRRRRAEAEQRGVGDVLELQAVGAVAFWAVLAVDVDPQGRDGVEVLAPPRIEPAAAAR